MKTTLVNIISNTIVRFIPMLAAFFLVPFVLRYTGKEIFGAWAIIGSFVGMSIMFDLGFGLTLEKEVAKLKIRNFPTDVTNFLYSTLRIQLVLSVIVLIIVFLFVNVVINFTKMSASLKNSIYQLQFFILISTFMKYWIGSFQSIIRGLERHYILLFRNIIYTVLSVFLLIIVLPQQPNLFGLLISDMLATFILLISFIIYLFHELKVSSLSFKRITISKSIFNYSINAFVLQMCAIALFSSGRLVLGIMVSVAEVAYYEIGAKIFDIIRNIFDQIARVFLPKASKFNEQKKESKILFLLENGTLYLFVLWGALAIPLLIVFKGFIILWLGKDFVVSCPLAYALIIATGFITLSRMSLNVFMGIGILERYSQIRGLSVLFFIALAIPLIKKFHAFGLALALLIYFILFESVIIIYSFRKFKINFFKFFKTKLCKVIALQLVLGISFKFISHNFMLSYLGIGIFFLIFNLFYMLGYYSLIFNRSDKEFFKSNFKLAFKMG